MNSRGKYRVLVAVVFLFFSAVMQAQVIKLNNVEDAFISISPTPKTFTFKSKYNAPAGGHLQGIQAYQELNKPFSGQIVLTGSSSTYSYYLKAQLNGKVDTLVKIEDSPLRHAGGCQVVRSLLFTGVEDNIAKDKAQVTVIALGDTFAKEVLKTRKGQFKRSTAGAVGATLYRGNLFVAVGDWDTRNIDFYLDADWRLDSVDTYSFGTDGPPCSYQSINLLTDTANHLYLIGLGKEGDNNRADLFLVENYQLKLIATRLFKTKNGCSFRYGAGINCSTAESLEIYTCQRRLKKNNKVNVFGN